MNHPIADLRRVDRSICVSHWYATIAGLVGVLWASAPSSAAAAEPATTPVPVATRSDARKDCLARGAAMRDTAENVSSVEAAALGDEVYWCAWSEGLDELAYEAAKHVMQRARLAAGRLDPSPIRRARLAEAAAMLRALDGELEEAIEDVDALSRTLDHEEAVYADVEVAIVVTLINAGRTDQALERLLKLEELTAEKPDRRVATDDARAILASALASMGRVEDAQTVIAPFVRTKGLREDSGHQAGNIPIIERWIEART